MQHLCITGKHSWMSRPQWIGKGNRERERCQVYLTLHWYCAKHDIKALKEIHSNHCYSGTASNPAITRVYTHDTWFA